MLTASYGSFSLPLFDCLFVVRQHAKTPTLMHYEPKDKDTHTLKGRWNALDASHCNISMLALAEASSYPTCLCKYVKITTYIQIGLYASLRQCEWASWDACRWI